MCFHDVQGRKRIRQLRKWLLKVSTEKGHLALLFISHWPNQVTWLQAAERGPSVFVLSAWKEENQSIVNGTNDCQHGNILARGNDCWRVWSDLGPWHTAYVCVRPALPHAVTGCKHDTSLHMAFIATSFH